MFNSHIKEQEAQLSQRKCANDFSSYLEMCACRCAKSHAANTGAYTYARIMSQLRQNLNPIKHCLKRVRVLT